MTFEATGKADWWVTRGAQNPHTDEDAAMASERWGPFPDRDSAQEELVLRTTEEYQYYSGRTDLDPSAHRARRIMELAKLGAQTITIGGLVWRAYPIEPRG